MENGVRVLIVEDSRTQAEQLKFTLEHNGYQVSTVCNGKEALALMNSCKPTVVISDIVMPETDGYELCRQIRANANLKDIPVILLTALSDHKDVIKSLECGANNFIVKPLNVEHLLVSISNILLNVELRKNSQVEVGTNVFFLGEKYFITADRLQILDLLLSTYENAYQKSLELIKSQEELKKLNEKLEETVDLRTAALVAEIKERKKAEKALRESEERYRAVAESANDAIVCIKKPGIVYLWNKKAEEIFGYSASEAIDEKLHTLIAPEKYRESEYKGLEAFFQTGTGSFIGKTLELSAVHKNGAEFPIELSVSAMKIQDEWQVIGIIKDITERKRSEERSRSQLQRLAALREIDKAIISSLDLRVTFEIILDKAISQLHIDAVDVLLLDPNMQMLEYTAGRGFHTADVQHIRMHVGESCPGRAALERRTICIPNLGETKEGCLHTKLLINESFTAYYCVPLIAKGQLKGVFEVFHRTPLDPDADWLNFLETLAGQTAIAVDNASLFEDLQRSNLDLILAYDATLEGWSRALDLRDKETEGHTQRVTEMTVKLANVMGIGKAELIHVRRGAQLHDIGKMGVPDNILLKPDKLTDEEWIIMRKHPIYAYEMLSPITYLHPALDIPYCHHEKWDGTGYPRGLKGEQIPFSARIFAVVDVWDGMRFDRPYRSGWPEEKVREYISALSGKQFDPRIVEVFLKKPVT